MEHETLHQLWLESTQPTRQPCDCLQRISAVYFQAFAGNIRLANHFDELSGPTKAENGRPPPSGVKPRCQHGKRALGAADIEVSDHQSNGYWPVRPGATRRSGDRQTMTEALSHGTVTLHSQKTGDEF